MMQHLLLMGLQCILALQHSLLKLEAEAKE